MLAVTAIFAVLLLCSPWPKLALACTTLGVAGVLWHLEGATSPVILAVGAAMVSVGLQATAVTASSAGG